MHFWIDFNTYKIESIFIKKFKEKNLSFLFLLSVILNSRIHIIHRPPSQNRQICVKRYGYPVHNYKENDRMHFIWILREKINAIVKECMHLVDEKIYQKRIDQPIIEKLNQIIINLEEENAKNEADIAIYNSVIDYIQEGTSIDDIISKCKELEKSNLRYAEEVSKISKENKDLEIFLLELEKEIPEIKIFDSKFIENKNSIEFNNKLFEKQLQKIVEDINKKIDCTDNMIQKEKKILSNIIEQIDEIENQRKKSKKEKTDLLEIQKRVYDSLVKTSNEITQLPSSEQFMKILNEIKCKEKVVHETQSELRILQNQVDKYRFELNHIDDIDIKIKNEIKSTECEIQKIKDKIQYFEFVEKNEKMKMKNKMIEINHLKSQIVNIKRAIKAIIDKYNNNYHQISTNQINVKLNSLEKVIGKIASENYSISKEIEDVKRKNIIKCASMEIVNEINDSTV